MKCLCLNNQIHIYLHLNDGRLTCSVCNEVSDTLSVQSRVLINKMLNDKSVQYHRLYERIDWKLFNEQELTDLIICYPEQVLMRFHLLRSMFFFSKIYLEKIIQAYYKKSCNTFFTTTSLYKDILDKDIVLTCFLEREKERCSYYNLSEIKMIRSCYSHKISMFEDHLLNQKEQEYQKLEDARHRSFSGGGEGRH
jgi:hypothetical protein